MKYELDVDRRADWMHTPGATALLTVGPLSFSVCTADGVSFGFAIRIGPWVFLWGVEPDEDPA